MLDNLELDPALVDEDRMIQYRLDRVQQSLAARDLDAMITFDPVNTRYATGVRNMQVWAFHSLIRVGFIPVRGRAAVFEYAGSEHLADGLDTVAEVLPAIPLHYGPGHTEDQNRRKTAAWLDQVEDVAQRLCGDGRRIALDNQAPHFLHHLLTGRGFEVVNGYAVLAEAMAVKNEDEIRAMARSVEVAERGMRRMEDILEPGISENQLWAVLNHTNIEFGGEYMDTRLLTSGPRTNPWYQECGDRKVEEGDLVALDTDMIGPYGYDADISRTFICGDVAPSPRQREAYRVAHDHVMHNIEILTPDKSFRELSEQAFRVPEKYRPQSIAMNWHGVSLYGGWPTILGHGHFNAESEDGIVVPGMTLCVEAYAGEVGGRYGVKLEEQVLVTETGVRVLSSYPFDNALLS